MNDLLLVIKIINILAYAQVAVVVLYNMKLLAL